MRAGQNPAPDEKFLPDTIGCMVGELEDNGRLAGDHRHAGTIRPLQASGHRDVPSTAVQPADAPGPR